MMRTKISDAQAQLASYEAHDEELGTVENTIVGPQALGETIIPQSYKTVYSSLRL